MAAPMISSLSTNIITRADQQTPPDSMSNGDKLCDINVANIKSNNNSIMNTKESNDRITTTIHNEVMLRVISELHKMKPLQDKALTKKASKCTDRQPRKTHKKAVLALEAKESKHI
uniref:Nuclear hormone receptor HR78 n=1 Tax=Lygus hesperus TaxID=30085 RepID=A0A0A9VPK1_LYGHE